MEENNVEQEVAQEPLQEQETPTPEPQVQETQGEVETQQSEETPPEAPQQEQPEYTGPNYDLSQYLQQPKVQAPEFTVDNDGFIDPNQFYNKVKADTIAEVREQIAFQEAEKRAWSTIEKAHPLLKEDSEIRDMVMAERIADVARGGRGDLSQIAKRVVGKFESYQTRGKSQAQVSEKVQKSASLQQSTANSVVSNKDNDLLDRMSRGDTSAADQLIGEWLDAGKL